MCLSCCKTEPNYPDITKEHKALLDFPPPGLIRVHDSKALRKAIEPDPEMVEKFGPYGVVAHVYFHWNDGQRMHLNYNQIEEICDHALALIMTGTDNWIDLWAVQWPNDFIPVHIKRQ